MTLNDLQLAVYQETGFSSPPDSKVVTRITAWLNEGQRRTLRLPAMSELRQGTFIFNSVSGQTTYAIPQVLERIDAIVDQTNGRKLRMLPRNAYRAIDPAERSSGLPDYYIMEGLQAVLRQPSQGLPAGTGVWAVSTQGADTTQKVNIQGVSANGDIRAPEQLTLNGLTRVASNITDYIQILSWNIDTLSVGSVQLFDANAAGNVLARIQPGFKSVQYEVLRLWPTATAAVPYGIDGQWLIQDMVQATDVPMLPPSYHDLLVEYARMREYDRTGDKRYAAAAAGYQDGVVKLREYVQFPPGYAPVAGTIDSSVRRNNLGSWYPSDWSWP